MKSSKKKYISILGLLLGAAVFFPAFSARATDFSSTNFVVKDPVVSQGAGFSASTSFQNTGNIGQPAIGISNSTSFILQSGFLYFPAPSAASSTTTPTPSPSSGGGGGGGGTGYYQSSSAPLLPQPSAGISSSTQSAQLSYLTSILQGIKNFIDAFLPHPPTITPPQLAVPFIPREAPFAFRGFWELISAKEMGAFVFAPLPQDIAVLGKKFPTITNTFKSAGVTRLSDLSKLQNVVLHLPNLTERIGLQSVALKTQPFALPKGIPIVNLPPKEKARIPSEIVFARIGGEKIDLPINLSLQSNGVLEKTIRTVVGSTLRLVVKPEYAAKSVKGYLVLKSRTRREETSVREQVSLQNMLASIFFVRPVFAEPANNAVYHLLAGAGPSTPLRTSPSTPDTSDKSDRTDRFYSSSSTASGNPQTAFIGPRGTNVEERLALSEFEYTDPDRDGIYTADVRAPGVDGEYEVITIISYEDPRFGTKEVSLTAVVDPEGYVFEQIGGKETRIPGAVVSLSYLNPMTKKYELWPGKDYVQENPQITDARGTYAFLVSPGTYSISVTAPGYPDYHGKPFQLSVNNEIHMNIEMKSPYGFLASVDFKTILLIALFLLVGYNFYKDKLRGMYTRQ